MTWPRPLPLVGDQSSAAERAAAVDAWALPDQARRAFYDVVASRRDIRRYRPDPVPMPVLRRVLEAAHAAPSVGHSQPWRFILMSAPETRDRAARMADEQRLRQAAQMEEQAASRLLDLQLEGIREAPLGVVVACDRRASPAGVLGRATFTDADLWSCACAIENLWLAARAEGLGVGWVTLFDPDELAELVQVPAGVETLGWLCLGWPDERPPAPGLERAGWSRRQPVDEVVMAESWDETVARPPSLLRAPGNEAVVGVRDEVDRLLTPPGSLGVLDRCVDRWEAVARARVTRSVSGTLLLAAGRHRVVEHDVSAYSPSVAEDVLAASRAGESAAAAAASVARLELRVVDAGSAHGDLVHDDAMSEVQARDLLETGRALGSEAGRQHGLVAVGEVGIGNTTVAAALTALLLGLEAHDVVGLGAGADSAMVERKGRVVAEALARVRNLPQSPGNSAVGALASLGGPEFCLLAGAVLGAAAANALVVLDGFATGVAAVAAVRMEPAVAAFLVAGQRSRERGHDAVLTHLGLEPLLDLRLRAGEGVGAALATRLLIDGIEVRARLGRTRG